MRARAAAALLITGAMAAAPASALAAGSTWTDAHTGLPASVNLGAVAVDQPVGAAAPVVLAVGRDTSSGEAAIYRYSGGTWQADTIAPSVPPDSCLTAVALSDQAAWAVGSKGGGCPGDSAAASAGTPLLVRFPGGGASALSTQAAPAQWATVADGSGAGQYPGAATPRAIALSGTSGYTGDAAGAVYSFTDGSALSFSPVNFELGPSAVSGIAAYSPQAGFAVGVGTGGADIYGLGTSCASAANTACPFQPPAPAGALTGVAALSPTQAIAIETSATTTAAPEWWAPGTSGAWQRAGSFATGASVNAVSIGQGSASVPAEAIAGSDLFSRGTVWQRTIDQPAFTAGPALACVPLRGIAVLNPSDIWAVGDQGTAVHYTSAAGSAAGCSVTTGSGGGSPPGAGQSGSVAGAGSNAGSSQSSGSSSGSGPDPASTQTASPSSSGSAPDSSSSAGPAPSNGPAPSVTVSQPPPKPKPSPSPGKPPRKAVALLSHVRVRIERGRLAVACKLSAPARVSAVVSRAGHVIGRAGWHAFHGGSCDLVVPFRGRQLPTRLQIFALPLSPAAARDPNQHRSSHHQAP